MISQKKLQRKDLEQFETSVNGALQLAGRIQTYSGYNRACELEASHRIDSKYFRLSKECFSDCRISLSMA